MHPKHHAVVAGITAFSIAMAALSAGAQTPSDPCVAVTAAQVSAALGETVGAGKQGPPPTCTWVADKPTHQIVTLTYSPPGDWNTRKNRVLPGLTINAVSGVGDDAIELTAAKFTTIFVKKGSTIFMVRVYGVSDPAKQLAIEKSIAQAVATKI
jgi:hypothetical protein